MLVLLISKNILYNVLTIAVTGSDFLYLKGSGYFYLISNLLKLDFSQFSYKMSQCHLRLSPEYEAWFLCFNTDVRSFYFL